MAADQTPGAGLAILAAGQPDCVPLFASRELYLTAVLYAAYLVNAGVSWRHWQQLATRPASPLSPVP